MNILVTGGAGYIGSVVSHQLIAKGHKVIVYDNFSTGYKEALHQNCKFVLGDVRDRELPARVMRDNKVELVMHFAAKLNVPESITHPLDYYDNNFLGTQIEYRFPLVWRFGMTTFAGLGEVFNQPSDVTLSSLKYSVGAGIRFAVNPAERLNIRFDYAYGKEGGYYYVSVAESF